MCEKDILNELLLKHVGITHSEANENVLHGPVKINNIWFNIMLSCPEFPKLNNFHLKVQERHDFKEFNGQSNEIINKNWTVEELIENIPNLMHCPEDSVKPTIKEVHIGQDNIYSEIAKLYERKECEIYVNETCSRIRFCKFSQNEGHFLELELPALNMLAHSLPSCIDWQNVFGAACNISQFLDLYIKTLEDLRGFYENFTDIDELCHVVQPSLPNTKDNWRLFVLKERVHIKLQLADPFSPLASMSVSIIGPSNEVAKFRSVYSDGLRDWDSELDIHKNLLRIFDLCFFPMPPSSEVDENTSYCNICYSYKLDEEVPIVSCDNAQCTVIFHVACLKEWFSSLADERTFLKIVFGACPFCKSKLSTSFEEMLV